MHSLKHTLRNSSKKLQDFDPRDDEVKDNVPFRKKTKAPGIQHRYLFFSFFDELRDQAPAIYQSSGSTGTFKTQTAFSRRTLHGRRHSGPPATSATACRPCPVSLKLPAPAVIRWNVGTLVLTYLEVVPEEPPPPVRVSEYNAGMD